MKLWAEWEASLGEGERAPNFLQKEKFLARLNPLLQEKVWGKFLETFDKEGQLARAKDQKLQFQANRARRELQPPLDEQLPQPQPHQAAQATAEDPHLELLQRVTAQLDDLSINLVQGPRGQPPPQHEAPPQRRPPMRRQELHCWNCGEDRHGMYFCPQPRRYAGNNQGRGPARQVTPPQDRPQAPAPPPLPVVKPQVLR